MSIGNLYKSGAAVFSGSGAFTLPSLQDIAVNPGLKTVSETAAGAVSPSFIATMNNEPMVTCKCTDLATMIANGIVLIPLALPTSTVITKVDLYGTNILKQGTIGGSGTHFKTSIVYGLVVLKSITIPQNGVASANLEIHGIFDGTHDPFQYTGSVSLPATWTISELFTMGPCAINGVTLQGITNVQIDLGVTVKTESSDGDTYPTFGYSSVVKPKVTFTCKDATQLSTYGIQGNALTSTTTKIFARALANGAVRIPDATASHVEIATSASQGIVYVENSSFSRDTGESKIVVEPIIGASAILTLASGVAISVP